MATTHVTALRTAIADLVNTYANAGSGAAKLKIRDGSNVLLATITLADPAFGAAVAGVGTLGSLPKSGTAVATGTAANFILTDSDDVTVFSGSVTATGGGGDVTLGSTAITSGYVVTVTAGTYTAPA